MTRVHQLRAVIGPPGVHLYLDCPYDDEPPDALTHYPDWMVPVCRPDRAARCAAASLVTAGHIGALWAGIPAPLADGMKIQLWADGDDVRMAAASSPETVEDLARNLARVSRSPRYLGDDWRKLLTAEANVDHAWKEASRYDVDRAAIDVWRDRLHAWHWERHGQTRTTLTPTD
jgi:hypothetical protein